MDAEMKQLQEELFRNGEKILELEKMMQSFEKLSKKRQSFEMASKKRQSCETLSKKTKRGNREATSCKRLNKVFAEQEVDDDDKENRGEDRKVKVENLPVPVLERVFSCLDWKDLGRAMLVCRRWQEVGGHPSLWTEFPLQLSVTNLRSLKKYSKIRRLAWVKSVTICYIHLKQKQKDMWKTLKREFVFNVVTLLKRVEELVFLDDHHDLFNPITNEDLANVFYMVQEVNKKVVRICAKRSLKESDGSPTSENEYFIANCDADTNKFIKKTVEKNDRQMIESIDNHSGGRPIRITGPPGVQFSNEVLETIFTIYKYPITLSTSLIIGQDIDLVRLKYLLSRHVSGDVYWDMNAEDLEKQEVAPINTILDQLSRWTHSHSYWDGNFDRVCLPRELVMKSHWLENLGGRARVKAEEAIGETNILSIKARYGGGMGIN